MGRNNADFHGVNISHELYSEFGVSAASLIATHPTDGEVGRMYLVDDGNTGTSHKVMNVQVHKNYRRKGIATALWNHAKAIGLNPKHDYDEQSDDGASWAKAVGD